MYANIRSGFIKNNKGLYFAGVFLLVVQIAMQLVTTWLLQILMDAGLKQNMELLKKGALYVVLALVVELFVGLGCVYTKAAFTKRILCSYKKESFRRMVKNTLRSFMRREQGDYLSAFTNDMDPVENGYIRALFNIPFYSVMLVGAIGMMLCYNVGYTLVVIVVSVIPLGIGVLAGKVMAPAEKGLSVANARFTAKLKEILGGVPVIKSFQAEVPITGLFGGENDELEKTRYRRRVIVGNIQAVMQCMLGCTQFIVFIYGAYLAVHGDIAVPVMIVFIQLMNSVNTPLTALPTTLAKYAGAKAVINRMEGLTENDPEILNESAISGLNAGIRLEKLSFSYEKEQIVIHNLEYFFEKNKTYAIVGPSGSGKSTLMKLLLGYFQNYEGNILYDGSELKTLSEDTLNRLISFVQQEVFLFDKTVEDNVTLFHPYKKEEVGRVLDKVGLSYLKGKDITCGDNGGNLSGGERQRVSVARALIRRCPIMFWDEATAALDPETTGRIMHLILSAAEITRIVITHYLDETILRQFDSILVLKDGTLLESGTYDELMERNGIFWAMKELEEA